VPPPSTQLRNTSSRVRVQSYRDARNLLDAIDEGSGWLAYLTVGDEDAEDVEEVAVLCPTCAAREFGGVHGVHPNVG
jgi:hypothetical protein